ncbi:hypothetical protein M758_12G059900 [Ceratodon purpureus]|uniref:Uncharacterized protein n=1 Tax=Ceratodon purpureus TaxID=3225 RepID=A0A8T0G554_CERPU|nr:hypothetical protein KC19_12G057400 [Ceratodon purpureus]KAG0598273.1 hypothetical protein M758_12G059900 [Ceratodon purpureus]
MISERFCSRCRWNSVYGSGCCIGDFIPIWKSVIGGVDSSGEGKTETSAISSLHKVAELGCSIQLSRS